VLVTILKLIFRSLVYYRLANAAVVLGAAVGVAVVTGSLLVGDSVKGSLAQLALDRLGRTDQALISTGYFREGLADDLAGRPEFRVYFAAAVPAIITAGAATNPESSATVPRVALVGVDARFQQIGDAGGPLRLDGRQAAINRALAEDLNLVVGAALIVAVPRPGAAPADSLFGRRKRDETVEKLRVTVAAILPDQGLSRFSLRSDRVRPRNVFVALPWLQEQLKHKGLANTILVTASEESGCHTLKPQSYRGQSVPGEPHTLASTHVESSKCGTPVNEASADLAKILAVCATVEDYGLRLVPDTARGYAALESRAVVLPPVVVEAARRAAATCGSRASPTSVYLANTLTKVGAGEKSPITPYSIVAAIDLGDPPPLGGLVSARPETLPVELAPGDMLINTWLAADLAAAPGDEIEMTWYQMADGQAVETRSQHFTVRGIVALAGPAADPGLAPTFEGISDATDLRSWHPPFPVDLSLIRDKDEAYWAKYRATPKAFISAAAAQRLWLADALSPQAGWVTSVRLDITATTVAGDKLPPLAEKFLAELAGELSPPEMGLAFRPVRAEALRAATGSTDYASLFLGLSSFLVIAAGLLVGLLVRLSIETRARQAGILGAVGFTQGGVARILLLEGLILALAAVLLGVPLGAAYARGIIWALATLWVEALGPFPLTLHVTLTSLAIGAAAGLAVAMLAAWWAVRLLRRQRPIALLGGWQAIAVGATSRGGRGSTLVAVVSLAAALAVVVLALATKLLPATPAFFISGALLLLAGLAAARSFLSLRPPQDSPGEAPLTMSRLACRYATRNRTRGLLTAGLVACASFIIVTVAANRAGTSDVDVSPKESGTGGFALLADSELPIYENLNTPAGRRAMGLGEQAETALRPARIYALPVRGGDDTSCLNLQKPLAPRLVGVPHDFVVRGGFTFAASEPQAGAGLDSGNPWELLEQNRDDGAVPVIGDEASVKWILQSGLGQTLSVPGPRGEVKLRVVGLLRGSIWQSELLMSERHFVREFDGGAGCRKFLIEAPPGEVKAVAESLRESLGDLGFDVRPTGQVLAAYAGVQNAYLSTFQTLGGLGLVLGTLGLVTVLLRSVTERRGELAVMLALGFTRRQVTRLVVLENALLLVIGLAVGLVAGLAAVAPHLVETRAALPWASLAGILAAVLALGVGACVVAAQKAVGPELLAAIRSE
jgi:ABC-type lipoprotein release transport system permease subunit